MQAADIKRKPNKKSWDMGKVTPYLFITPQLVLFFVFFVIPAVIGIAAAFMKWDILSSKAPEFVGFDNFRQIFFDEQTSYYRLFRKGMIATLSFVVYSVPFLIVLPLLMSVALHARPFGHKFFQSVFYMPSILSISTVVMTWYYLFNRNFGIINRIFNMEANWFGNQPYAWMAIVIITVWWTIGGNLVIYLAAMASVPRELYESASIDGANSLHKFRYITIPCIKNQLTYTVILTSIASFNIYGQPLMTTNGGPVETTNVMLMVIRNLAFPSNGGKSITGIATAMALMLGLCIIVVSVFQYRFTTKNTD